MESFREWHICVAVTRFTAHLAGYGKMMTGHVGIPKCASAYSANESVKRFFTRTDFTVPYYATTNGLYTISYQQI
jgi:hypothetical protein